MFNSAGGAEPAPREPATKASVARPASRPSVRLEKAREFIGLSLNLAFQNALLWKGTMLAIKRFPATRPRSAASASLLGLGCARFGTQSLKELLRPEGIQNIGFR